MANSAFANADEKATRESFDSNGVKISYLVQGKGEPVVLIHGWMASAALNWEIPGIISSLAKNYQVIAIDVRGHGESGKPTKDEAYGPELVEDIVRLLDHLKIKKAHIVGYSMGGIITLKFVAKHPDRALSGLLGGMGWMKKGGLGEWFFEQLGKNDQNAMAFMTCGRSLAKLALTEEELKSIKVPVAVLIGDDDGIIRRLFVDPLKLVRKDWPVTEIKGASHITCILKQSFRDEIVAWLKRNSK
jgi:pimeloyl-ACP methyl ester carboxylesterase